MTRHEFLLPGRNGYGISCLEWVPDREAAVLICLHGFAGDKYSSVISALGNTMVQNAFRVLTFDWPGHGSSPADGSRLSVENCLGDLDTVLRHCRRSGLPLCLFATSFGGFLGVHFLLRQPDAFSRVILRSPALNMPDTFRALLPDEEAAVMDAGGLINKGFDRPLYLGRDFYEDLCRHCLPAPPRFSLPGLIIQGDLDDVVSPEDSVSFAAEAGWQLHLVRGADHRYKNPGELEEIISVSSAFLSGDRDGAVF